MTPKKGNLLIGDKLQDNDNGSLWKVVAVDSTGLTIEAMDAPVLPKSAWYANPHPERRSLFNSELEDYSRAD